MNLTALIAAAPLAVPLDAPLEPGREQARDWARQELSDPLYAAARPGVLERALGWLLQQLEGLDLPGELAPSSRTGLVLLLVVGALVVAVVLLRTGRLRGPGRVASADGVFDDVRRTSGAHRALADRAADRGAWDVAVRERFRAVVRALEERTVLDERPGRTAHEAAETAGTVLPEVAGALRSASVVFDDVCYGGRPALRDHDLLLRTLDQQVAEARPRWDDDAAVGSAVAADISRAAP